MKNRLFIIGLLTAAVVLVVALNTAGASVQGDPVSAIRDSVLSYFHPASGVVRGFEKDRVIIALQDSRKFEKGTRFSVYREGKPFYHPVTKVPIGKAEEFIGRIEIEKTDGETYLCRVISGEPEIGDIVRITSSRIKLAFFQDKKAQWELSEAFYHSLKGTGRFDFIESYTESLDAGELSRLARDLGAEAVLLLSTPVRDKNILLNVRLFWSEDAFPFAELEEALGEGAVEDLAAEKEFVPTISPEALPWASYELEGGELIAMGDVNGNGGKELVVSDGINLRIYSFDRELRELWFLKGSSIDEHLSIDVLDLNNNGRAEIFVTSLRNEKTLQSFAFEYDSSEGYKKIWEKTHYALRVTGKTLLMQAVNEQWGFTGSIHSMVWKDGDYQPDRTVSLPGGIDLYGFGYVDWQNTGRMHILAFDDNGYLNLYDNDKLIWKSKDSYGRSDMSFKKQAYAVVSPDEKWFVKGRLITVKTERGQEAIAIKKVPLMTNVPGLGYKKAEVYSLWWDGATMEETAILSGIAGTASDYLVDGDNLLIIARADLLMFLKKTVSGDFSRKSILYYYNLGGK